MSDLLITHVDVLTDEGVLKNHAIAINNGNVNISGDNSHGMVVSKTTNALGPDSSFVNNGKISVTANDSGGMTVLGKIQGGAINNGTITIAAKNSSSNFLRS